jgi:hypothetical protein
MGFGQRRSTVADGYDYADAFEARLSEADIRTAEQVVRAGLDGAPLWLRMMVAIAHRHVLRLELAAAGTPNHVAGWEIVDSEGDRITLRASGSLIDGQIVARRPTPSTAVLETFVKYRRPVLARLVWTAVAPVHRAVAPTLLRNAVNA